MREGQERPEENPWEGIRKTAGRPGRGANKGQETTKKASRKLPEGFRNEAGPREAPRRPQEGQERIRPQENSRKAPEIPGTTQDSPANKPVPSPGENCRKA